MPINNSDITRFATPGFFYDKVVFKASGSESVPGHILSPYSAGTKDITTPNTYGKKMPVFIEVSNDNVNWYLFQGPVGSFGLDFLATTACTDSTLSIHFENNNASAQTIYWRAFGIHLWPS